MSPCRPELACGCALIKPFVTLGHRRDQPADVPQTPAKRERLRGQPNPGAAMLPPCSKSLGHFFHPRCTPTSRRNVPWDFPLLPWDAQNLQAPSRHTASPTASTAQGAVAAHTDPSWSPPGQTRGSPEELLFPELHPTAAELQAERDLAPCRAGDQLWLTVVSLDLARDVHFG